MAIPLEPYVILFHDIVQSCYSIKTDLIRLKQILTNNFMYECKHVTKTCRKKTVIFEIRTLKLLHSRQNQLSLC